MTNISNISHKNITRHPETHSLKRSMGGGNKSTGDDLKTQLQQALQYQAETFQKLNDPKISNQDRQKLLDYLNKELAPWINQAKQELGSASSSSEFNQSSDWDPLMTSRMPTPDWQSKETMRYEKGSHFQTEVDIDEKRDLDLFPGDSSIDIPSNAADVHVSVTADSDKRFKTMAVATVTFPDGTTREIRLHNFERSKATFKIRAGSTEQISLDDSAKPFFDSSEDGKVQKGKIKIGDLDTTFEDTNVKEDTSSQDPNAKIDKDGNRKYDTVGKDLSFSPVKEGTNKKTNVMTSKGDVTIVPNSNEEYYIMDYLSGPPAKYEVKVYANEDDKNKNVVKETITIDVGLLGKDHKLHLGADETRVEYGSHLADKADPHKLDPNAVGAGKIDFVDITTLDEEGNDVSALTKELGDYKTNLQKSNQLSDAEKQPYFKQIDDWVNDLKNKMGTPDEVRGKFDALKKGLADVAALTKELGDYKVNLQKSTKLSKADIQSYSAKIDGWIDALKNKMATPDDIKGQFDILKKDLVKANTYSPALLSLSSLTQKSPAELEALMKKYNLDPAHLPSPPDSRVASLLNDPAFSSKLSSLKTEAVKTLKDLKDEIAKQTSAANALNASNVSSNTSQQDNLDISSFKFLYDAKNHKDDKTLAVIDAKKKLADETGSLLSALYGKSVTAKSADPENAGKITFEGTDLNLFSATNEDIAFSSGASTWPDIQLVTYSIDTEGDGKTPIEQWMKDAAYPVHVYDTKWGQGQYDATANKITG